jgi:hypothetical protein
MENFKVSERLYGLLSTFFFLLRFVVTFERGKKLIPTGFCFVVQLTLNAQCIKELLILIFFG